MYPEISKGGQTFYKHSNDNNTYTELAAPTYVKTGDDCLGFFFLGEFPSLDNGCVGAEYLNSPRQIGFVKVSKDLSKVCSPGKIEKGGFYTFTGKWTDLQNEGICQLTNSKNSLSKLKVIEGKNCFVLLYETWSH